MRKYFAAFVAALVLFFALLYLTKEPASVNTKQVISSTALGESSEDIVLDTEKDSEVNDRAQAENVLAESLSKDGNERTVENEADGITQLDFGNPNNVSKISEIFEKSVKDELSVTIEQDFYLNKVANNSALNDGIIIDSYECRKNLCRIVSRFDEKVINSKNKPDFYSYFSLDSIPDGAEFLTYDFTESNSYLTWIKYP